LKRLKLIIFIFPFLLFLNNANAQEIKLHSIGVKGGIILPEGDWNTGYTVGVQVDMGEIIKELYLVSSVNFMNSSKTITNYGISNDLSLAQFTIGADLFGYSPVKPKNLYGGIGIYFHYIQKDIAKLYNISRDVQINSIDDNKLGFALLVGYLIDLKTTEITLGSRYILANDGYNAFLITLGVNLPF